MSRSASPPGEPRRGARTRKVVERFEPGGDAAGQKGKRRAVEEDGEDEGDEGDDDDSGDEESEQESRPLKNNKRIANGARKARPTAAPKKGKSRAVPNAESTAAPLADIESTKNDCSLFNALLSPDIALASVIDDWVDHYQSSAGDESSERSAVHELVLCFVRCCGMSADVDEDEVMDIDGVGDVIERIQDESMNTSLAIYPLISKGKHLRAFKTNLNRFVSTLVQTLSLTPILYANPDNTSHSTPLLPLLLNWLESMASSPLRPIRHTSTYLALKINSALCDVAVDVSKELGLKQRQRETEAKKGKIGVAAQKRMKEAEKKITEVHERKTTLEQYMQDIFDIVFVHRVRDSDAAIRTDCIEELGTWVKTFPERYMSGSYLNYLVRGCNDPDSHARLETVKALASLFAKETFSSNAGTVTLRLAPRLIEMALRDVDLSVRVNAISVITQIDKTGILADEDEGQRTKVARLVFDAEPRVRRAIGAFMRGLWEEKAQKLQIDWEGARGNRKKRGAGISEDVMASHLEWKALAALLVETSFSLEEPTEDAGPSKAQPVFGPSTQSVMTRANAAVEALLPEIEKMQDWEGLVDYLLLDHSTVDQDMWLLDEDEENFLLQLLIACIKREDKEEGDDERTKTFMKVLPQLFAKHQADVTRIAGILSIPQRMNLSLYLDMRKSTAYNSLWDDVSKQFLQHTDPNVLTSAIQAISHLEANTSMMAANAIKLLELQDALFGSLRDALDGEEVATLALTDDQVAALEAILLRISLLERSRDLVDIMEDEEGGQSPGWDIICAFAERGELGYKEEEKLVEYAVNIVFLHLIWLLKRFSAEDSMDEVKVIAIETKRDRAVEIFQRLAIRTQMNAVESVRRQAFICFVNTHILFSSRSQAPAAKAASLTMADEVQHRLEGAFQATVERYASDSETAGLEDDEEEPRRKAQDVSSVERAQQELLFLQLVSVFIAAIRTGVLEVDHAKAPLAHYGRFGLAYDAIVKKLVDVLRDEGIYNRVSDTVQAVATAALQESFTAFLETNNTEPTATLSLAKLIASAFVVHGTHFNVLKQIKPDDVVDLHFSSIDWIARKISGYIKQEKANKNKEAKSRLQTRRYQALTFFRPLAALLGPIAGRDAIRIKNHAEEQMEGSGAPMNGTKAWDSYKAYEKRLVGIASRDENMKNASRRLVADTQAERGARMRAKVAQDGGKGKRKAAEEEAEGELVGEDRTEGTEGHRTPSPPPATPSKKRRPAPGPARSQEDDRDAEKEQEDNQAPNHGAGGDAEQEIELDLRDFELQVEDVDMDEALGLGGEDEFELPDLEDLPNQLERERSVSVDPVPKKRRLAKKF